MDEGIPAAAPAGERSGSFGRSHATEGTIITRMGPGRTTIATPTSRGGRFRLSRMAPTFLVHAVAVLVAWPAFGFLADHPSIRLNPPKNGDLTRATIDVSGLEVTTLDRLQRAGWDESTWSSWLGVRVAGESSLDPPSGPPIVGRYAIAGDIVRFTPRYPFRPGLAYRVDLDVSRTPGADPARPGEVITTVLSIPSANDGDLPRVVRIDPAGDVLPENLLKFYIHFSTPMGRGQAYPHLRLLDDRGETIDGAFLELGEELWNPDQTRFTALLDPGRIKRGLRPREEDGPILEEGRTYTLVVDQDWTDARGRKLAESRIRRFTAGSPDEIPPDPSTWSFCVPQTNSRDPLRVRFPEPLDRALLERTVIVVDPAGARLDGDVVMDETGLVWSLRPERPWQPGAYTLRIDTDLEDLAGNGVGRPFEVDVFETIERSVESRFVTIPFEITARPGP